MTDVLVGKFACSQHFSFGPDALHPSRESQALDILDARFSVQQRLALSLLKPVVSLVRHQNGLAITRLLWH